MACATVQRHDHSLWEHTGAAWEWISWRTHTAKTRLVTVTGIGCQQLGALSQACHGLAAHLQPCVAALGRGLGLGSLGLGWKCQCSPMRDGFCPGLLPHTLLQVQSGNSCPPPSGLVAPLVGKAQDGSSGQEVASWTSTTWNLVGTRTDHGKQFLVVKRISWGDDRNWRLALMCAFSKPHVKDSCGWSLWVFWVL